MSSSKELTNEELELLVEATKFSKEDINNLHVRFYESLPNDGLDVLECFKLFEINPSEQNSVIFKEFILELFDTDKNGFVDFKEYMFGLALVRCLSEDNDESKDAIAKLFFKLSDKNQSNGVDRDELRQFLKFISSFDKTNQIEVTCESIQKELENTLNEVFVKFDSSGKDYLNEEEFAKFFNFYL